MRNLLCLKNELLPGNNPAVDYHTVPRARADTRRDSWIPRLDDKNLAKPRASGYSSDLINLVKRCLRVNVNPGTPFRRPDPVTLFNRIQNVSVLHMGQARTRNHPYALNDRARLDRLDNTITYQYGMAVPVGFP